MRCWGMIGAGCVALLIASPGFAATITVNTTQDLAGGGGKCSLRAAITAANADAPSGMLPGDCPAGSGADMVVLPAGHYTLSIAGPGEDANASGDLDISGDLTIQGV